MSITLYQTPPSFYSQIARLVLAEKGVAYERYLAAAGPPTFETYEPWYMRLNPGGTVPTLVAGECVVADSREILHFVDAHFDGPALSPTDEAARAEMADWIERAYQLPERTSTYGSPSMRRVGAFVNRGRLHALERNLGRHPEMSEVYRTKIEDIRQFMADTASPETVGALESRAQQELDALDAVLADRPFVCGESYSLADVVWTVMLARQKMNGHAVLDDRPNLRAWYRRVRSRPSFVSAGIWERFHPEILLPQILWKLRYRVVAGLGGLAAAALGLAWIAGAFG